MDNITLTEEQLFEMKLFIRKRGINESDVINEILDHFACKTEEIMNHDFRIPFERAMQLAHQSFGNAGFRPMVVNYELQIGKVVWSEFKKSLKDVLVSPKILGAICFSLFTYLLLSLAQNKWKYEWLLELELAELFIILLIVLAGQCYLIFKKNGLIDFKNDKKNPPYWQKKVLGLPHFNALVGLFPTILCTKIIGPYNFMIACCIFSFISMIGVMAKLETMKKLSRKLS